ncbi:spore coat protein [Halobacillus salinarum]|uniref:Spore coat protein n=1 Tax=Halobacillus salinarum TaxID=2932257 RepID=A0ABY4EPX5_9BACI|nr:CotY/CotZ family spore coat protein [Halobacillus salinarum]UOQ46508.1 spore coat protein [Halobacillus salinarum]
MSCGKNYDSGSCVIDILRDIVDAQNDVLTDCMTSCEQSIADLLGDTGGGTGLDTVPVILYCKGTCKPFKGFGSRKFDDYCNVKGSFFFRVKSVDDDGCAILELLFSERLLENNADSAEDNGCHKRFDPESPAEQNCNNLRASGICITVDLNCFCHVTCLPAVAAL